MSSNRYAELVINIEAPLENTFHYHVPGDLRARIRPGHLVEVEFGRRLAQGVVLRLDDETPVEDTKPVIALVDARPVLFPWQLQLAQWLHEYYLAPLNACIRRFCDAGTPEKVFTPADAGDHVPVAVVAVIENVIAQVERRNQAAPAMPTLSIE